MDHKCIGCHEVVISGKVFSLHANADEYMYSIIEEPSKIIHPICTDCLDKMIGRVDNEIKEKEKITSLYRNTLNDIETLLEQPTNEANQINQNLAKLTAKQDLLTAEQAEIDNQIKQLLLEDSKLDNEEDQTMSKINAFEKNLIENKEKEEELKRIHTLETQIHQDFTKYSSLSDAFNIQINKSGSSSINGCELTESHDKVHPPTGKVLHIRFRHQIYMHSATYHQPKI